MYFYETAANELSIKLAWWKYSVTQTVRFTESNKYSSEYYLSSNDFCYKQILSSCVSNVFDGIKPTELNQNANR
jgi:hypothetical protein